MAIRDASAEGRTDLLDYLRTLYEVDDEDGDADAHKHKD